MIWGFFATYLYAEKLFPPYIWNLSRDIKLSEDTEVFIRDFSCKRKFTVICRSLSIYTFLFVSYAVADPGEGPGGPAPSH